MSTLPPIRGLTHKPALKKCISPKKPEGAILNPVRVTKKKNLSFDKELMQKLKALEKERLANQAKLANQANQSKQYEDGTHCENEEYEEDEEDEEYGIYTIVDDDCSIDPELE